MVFVFFYRVFKSSWKRGLVYFMDRYIEVLGRRYVLIWGFKEGVVEFLIKIRFFLIGIFFRLGFFFGRVKGLGGFWMILVYGF